MSGTGKLGRLGFALCGSYCTFAQVFPVLEELAAQWDVTPISVSYTHLTLPTT